jgi:hypothetical protein
VFRDSGLEICPDTEVAVEVAVGRLAYFSTYQSLPSSPQFCKIGHKDARKELDDLADSAEMLIARLRALSLTAFNSLAEQELQVGAKMYIKTMSSNLTALAKTARRAEVISARGRGREKNERANGAARIVVDAFEAISGCDADNPANISEKQFHDKPRGLEPLVRKIFELLHIEGHPKAAIEAALKERKKQRHPSGRGRPGRLTTSKEFFERMRRTELASRGPKFWKNKNIPPLEPLE